MVTATVPTNSTQYGLTTSVSLPNPQCNELLDLTFWILDGIIAGVILLGNVFTCLVFLSKRQLRQNFMNIFLLSLACSDTLMGLLVAPWFASFCETKCRYPLTLYCFWFGMLRDIPFQSVLLNLIAITYDRYLAVFRPLVYCAKMTKRRVAIILTLVWVLPVATALLRMTWTFSDISQVKRAAIDRSFNIFLVFVFVVIPIIGIFIVNLMIMYTIHKHNVRVAPRHPGSTQQSETSESERREKVRKKRGTMSCIVVVLVFFVCWLPRIAYNFFFLARKPQLATDLFIKLSMFFLLLQSTVNPFIYSFYRQEFRQAALQVLRWYN